MTKTLRLLTFAFLFPFVSLSQTLQVSENGRYLQTIEGAPFLYIGDTAWELFHRLNREEAEAYLKNRAEKGFTVIQAVVLAELDGLHSPNPYGSTPLVDNDPTRPKEAYFEHVDFIVNKAEELGLMIGMLPTWGDKFNLKWGVGPEIFTKENAHAFGEFLGNRYQDKPIIWILGGDRSPEEAEDFDIIRAMAAGLHAGDGGTHLMTYHPQGGQQSFDFFAEDEWIDFHMYQSGHGGRGGKNYQVTSEGYTLTPIKPVLDGEPNYEDHPINWRPENGWFDEFDTRRAAWWSFLAGACGHSYGNHNIWQMWTPDRSPVSQARTPWYSALDHPGAFQMGYMATFLKSIAWETLEPFQPLIASGPNTEGKDLRAAMSHNKDMALVYAPWGSTFSLHMSHLKEGSYQVNWVNPRIGEQIHAIPVLHTGQIIKFDPPADEQEGNDWVLWLQRLPGEGQ